MSEREKRLTFKDIIGGPASLNSSLMWMEQMTALMMVTELKAKSPAAMVMGKTHLSQGGC